MVNKELIEKLKTNKLPFCFLPKEERVLLVNIGKENCTCLRSTGRFRVMGNDEIFHAGRTYRVDLEFEEAEKLKEIWFGIWVTE